MTLPFTCPRHTNPASAELERLALAATANLERAARLQVNMAAGFVCFAMAAVAVFVFLNGGG